MVFAKPIAYASDGHTGPGVRLQTYVAILCHLPDHCSQFRCGAEACQITSLRTPEGDVDWTTVTRQVGVGESGLNKARADARQSSGEILGWHNDTGGTDVRC